jgi:hypothetical protein
MEWLVAGIEGRHARGAEDAMQARYRVESIDPAVA